MKNITKILLAFSVFVNVGLIVYSIQTKITLQNTMTVATQKMEQAQECQKFAMEQEKLARTAVANAEALRMEAEKQRELALEAIQKLETAKNK